MASGPGRDYRLDFFRGFSLFFIFIDHIPDNIFSAVTLHSFALNDAAEVFIYISGYTAALVFTKAIERYGMLVASARIWRRVWQLYVAHLCLFMLYNAEVSYTMARFDNPLFADELQVGAFLEEPAQTILRVLMLQFQPTFLDILPLYIALLLIFPLILMALRRGLLVALLPSLALYAVARIWNINLPGYPEDRTWTFNPLGWQLLFVIGAAFGHANAMGRTLLPPQRWQVWVAGAVALFGLAVRGSWILHELNSSVPALFYRNIWPLNKTELPLLRLANMLALALLVARLVPRHARFLTGRAAWPIVLCGQNSLEIFCLSILLSVMGNVVYTVMGLSFGVQACVNVAGCLMLLGFGLLLAWFDGNGHLPRPAAEQPAV
jgi:hypothetical protein